METRARATKNVVNGKAVRYRNEKDTHNMCRKDKKQTKAYPCPFSRGYYYYEIVPLQIKHPSEYLHS